MEVVYALSEKGYPLARTEKAVSQRAILEDEEEGYHEQGDHDHEQPVRLKQDQANGG